MSPTAATSRNGVRNKLWRWSQFIGGPAAGRPAVARRERAAGRALAAPPPEPPSSSGGPQQELAVDRVGLHPLHRVAERAEAQRLRAADPQAVGLVLDRNRRVGDANRARAVPHEPGAGVKGGANAAEPHLR